MSHRQGQPHRRSFDEVGHAHMLTFSCYQRFQFLKAERTCVWLAETIDRARARGRFDLWAYVFMPDHVHLLVRPTGSSIRIILKGIKQPVGRQAVEHLEQQAPHWLPRITIHHGDRVARRFWQPGGGYDRNIIEPQTLRLMLDYIHANPVRRGLVERADDWHWSSAGWFAGQPLNPLRPDPIPPEWCT